MNRFRYHFSLVFILISTGFASGQVVINEYSASNLSQFQDNYSKYEDWIELHNPSAVNVNLGGYYLSDDSLNAMKWVIPNTVNIPAGGYVRFWADGRDLTVGTNFHTGFKLTQTKSNKEDATSRNVRALLYASD